MLTLVFRKKRKGANSIEGVFGALEGMLAEHRNLELPVEGASPASLWRNLKFVRRRRGEVSHITGDVQYAVMATGGRTLLTVHDVGSAFTGNWLKRLYVKILWFVLPTLIAKRISVISQATKEDLIRIAPWAKNKITVIPDPYNTVFEGEEKDNMASVPRILHIGTKPNKNLERAIQALKGLDCHLVIIGRMSEEQMDLVEASGLSIENKCDIPLEELVEEYRRCDIVSFPSMFEGFGMPIIESQAAGRPVVVGDIPVLKDVAGDGGALFVNPHDIDSIRDGFLRLMNDRECCRLVIRRGKQNIRRFHPQIIADMYNKIYREL